MSISPDTLALVEQALPAPGGRGLRPADVWFHVGQGALSTVRYALAQLVASGRATFEGKDCQRRYWRTERTA